ncbi:MAG: hypothetical protein Q4C49_11080 [Bacillota bacterium]|nr:hypothetical protein [Bacillota bacterium]
MNREEIFSRLNTYISENYVPKPKKISSPRPPRRIERVKHKQEEDYESGFHKEGFDWFGYDKDGYDKAGFDRDGYNRSGYDREGYDKEGYDRFGVDRYGYKRDGYNKHGFDRNGYNRDGYDREGYDESGYDRNGYDRNGKRGLINRSARLTNRRPSLLSEPWEIDLEDLEEIVENKQPSFSDMLFDIIWHSKYEEVEVYKKARIDRKLFSKIRSDENYHPRKITIFRLILALELDIEDAEALLNSAGYSFSNSSQFDLIVKFFVKQHNYDVALLNDMLHKFGEKMFD